VQTAGRSPNMAAADKILAVDRLGTALVREEFGKVIVPGGAGLVISSMDIDPALGHTPADELLKRPALQPSAVPDSDTVYGI
jgi:hypothetical protein